MVLERHVLTGILAGRSTVTGNLSISPERYKTVSRDTPQAIEYRDLTEAINESRRLFFADPILFESHVDDSDRRTLWKIEGK